MRFELQGLRQALQMFPEGTVFKAARSSVNKVGTSGRQFSMDEIRGIWNVPEAVLRDRISVSPARLDNLEVVLTFAGRSISLSYFQARQFRGVTVITRTKVMQRKRRSEFQGVQVEIEKGKVTQLSSAFMQRVKSGHIGVFIRVGAKRYPIIAKAGISVASMLEQPRVKEGVVLRLEERMAVVFPHELDFYLQQAGLL